MKTHSKAFTLIEFLIALVIIGFIVAMLVSFMSNPLSEATIKKSVSKITDDTRMFSDAMQKYYMDHGTEILAADTFSTELTGGTSPAMTGIPLAPASAVTDGTSTYVYVAKDDATIDAYTGWGTVEMDAVVILQNVNSDVCKKINENAGISDNGGLGDVIPKTDRDLQCFTTAAANANLGASGAMSIVVKPIHIH